MVRFSIALGGLALDRRMGTKKTEKGKRKDDFVSADAGSPFRGCSFLYSFCFLRTIKIPCTYLGTQRNARTLYLPSNIRPFSKTDRLGNQSQI